MVSTLVVGIDSASFSVLSDAMDHRDLPTFERLFAESSMAELTSTVPPMTPQAWTTIATGRPPAEHGVQDFREIDPDTYEVSPTTGGFGGTVTVWDMWGADGGSVGVVNHPMAHPPDRDCEFFVSGIPNAVEDGIGHPESVQEYLESSGYQVKPRTSPDREDEYLAELEDLARNRCTATIDLASEHEPEVLWTVFMFVDWAQHHLWGTEDRCSDAVLDTYELMDRLLGELDSQLDPETLIVVSDHGMTGIDGEVHMNSVLAELGYLQRTERDGSLLGDVWAGSLGKAYSLLSELPTDTKERIKSFVPERFLSEARYVEETAQAQMHRRIDWENTTAFSFGSMGRLFVNSESRFRRGTVPREEYDDVVAGLVEDVGAVEHPATAEPFVGAVYRPDGPGDELPPNEPDVRFETTDSRYMVYGDFGEESMHAPRHRDADHDRTGIFLARGPAANRGGSIESAREIDILDVARTMLALTGTPVHPEMGGEVRTDLFVEDDVTVTTTAPDVEDRETEPVDYETGDIEDRLEDLGYL